MIGQVAVVTGASRGIGRAAAVALAAQGAHVAVNYRTGHDDALSVVKQIEALGATAIAIRADVADPTQAGDLVDRAVRELGGLHILVNNAGIARDGLIAEADPDDAWQVMGVNFGGVLHCTRAAAAHLLGQRHGCIVNVSSVMSEGGWAGGSSYAAAKAAINTFTLSSAVEFARFGVRVNAVLPGFTRTDLVKALLHKGLERQIPMRAFAGPEQIAGVIAFLASPAATYLTGALIRVDGGFGAQLGLGRIGGG